VAHATILCRPDLVTSYPITPMSEVVEQLSALQTDGLMDAEMMEVEGENSAMNVVTAISISGGWVFTATSSWGLSFMYYAVQHAAGFRTPVVMAIQELTRLVRTFAHLKEKNLHRLQQTADEKYAFLKTICTLGSS
jgi:pyruvate/2-oxoacid:ferredoxin oxidoreductase alpha subunit